MTRPPLRRLLAPVSLAALALAGCKHPEPAPSELTELCAWLYLHQDDPEELPEGTGSLQAWLGTRGYPGEEGYALPPLTEEDVAEVEHPDRDLSAAIGAVADAISPAALDSHAAFLVIPDQSVVNPDDYEQFDRELLEGEDCFLSRDCELLRTWNTVIKNGAFGVTIPYEYGKDYRWVDSTDDTGLPHAAIVSRGWVPLESFGEDGNNGILLSFTLDVFLAQPDGTTHRVQAQWSEMELALELPDDYLRNELIDGLREVFEDTDAAIAALGL